MRVLLCADTEKTPKQQPQQVTISADTYTALIQSRQHLLEANAKLEAKAKSLETAVAELQAECKRQTDQLRGAHSQATKLKKTFKDMKASTTTHGTAVRSAVVVEDGVRKHTTGFMAGVRFIKHACILSNQKASLALDLFGNLLIKTNSGDMGWEVSPTTLSRWNVVLGEVDRLNLSHVLATVDSDVCLFADDSNKGHDERHIMGVHVWSAQQNRPVGYILANTVIASSRGSDQASADHHILTSMFGVKSVATVMGDNATTQSGAKKGHAVELGKLFGGKVTFIGCYPHIVNIALKTAIGDGFGGRGGMSAFNLYQLHFKVAYVHHQHPSYYRALYT
eukprot:scpid75139/ scgid17326/ 